MEYLENEIAKFIYNNINAGHKGKTARLMAQEILAIVIVSISAARLQSGNLLSALNKMWREQCSMCCKLPCDDAVCREDMNSEGGCFGADFADKLTDE